MAQEKLRILFHPATLVLVIISAILLAVVMITITIINKERSFGYSNESERCTVVVGWSSTTVTSQMLYDGCSKSIGCQYTVHIANGLLGGVVRGEQIGPKNDGKECLGFALSLPEVPLAVRQTIQADILLKRDLARPLTLE